MEHTNGIVDLVYSDVKVRAGFRVTKASQYAGGPVELEFFIDVTGSGARYLLIEADRSRQRPGNVSFVGTFNSVPLTDPSGNVPDIGGPAGVVDIKAGRPWHQPLILNQFLRLEAALDLLQPGESGPLVITCRRPLPLGADEQAALANISDTPIIEVQLSLSLYRDDTQLITLVDQLITEVRYGPREQRERPLALLLALRTPIAVKRWQILADHDDPLVQERVRQALYFAR